jgi:hypothetical protein
MTRNEHMNWCKQRAKQEFAFYLPTEGIEAACRNGVASMCADLGKHSETAALVQTAVLVGLTARDARTFQQFVDGFH